MVSGCVVKALVVNPPFFWTSAPDDEPCLIVTLYELAHIASLQSNATAGPLPLLPSLGLSSTGTAGFAQVNSTEPTSKPPSCGRGMPRWSMDGAPVSVPLSMAGLPTC